MSSKLSVLCVTNGDGQHVPLFVQRLAEIARHIRAEFILGLDGETAQQAGWVNLPDITRTIPLRAGGTGVLEDVLDQAIDGCDSDWILRLDDDEMPSAALVRWLDRGDYMRGSETVYSFERAYLWGNEEHYITNDPLWPDWQTRLTVRERAGGRRTVHAGSPWGAGTMVRGLPIMHYKFLVRNMEQRMVIARHYERSQPGAGLGALFSKYNLPEVFLGNIDTAETRKAWSQ
jgi:hypothetical protein